MTISNFSAQDEIYFIAGLDHSIWAFPASKWASTREELDFLDVLRRKTPRTAYISGSAFTSIILCFPQTDTRALFINRTVTLFLSSSIAAHRATRLHV